VGDDGVISDGGHRAGSVTPWSDAAEVLWALPGAVLVMVGRRIVFANAAAFELFGVPDLDALVERAASRAHVLGEDVERVDERLGAIERGDTVSASAEYRILRPDGSARVVEWSSVAITFGGRAALLCAVDDVTTLALARDVLAVSERHQRDVIATLAEGVIVVDTFGVCTNANPAAARMLGLDAPAQLIGLHADLMPMVDDHGHPLPHARHPVWRALEHGEQIRNEVFSILFPQRTHRMRVSTIPFPGGGAVGGGAVVTFDDVTAQHEDHERTAQSEERFRNLAGNAPVAVFETNADGICTFVNERWCAFTGLDSCEALGIRWTVAVDEDDVTRVECSWTVATGSSQPFKSEFHFAHTDGTTTYVSCEAAPIIDHDGRISGWIGTATDLSAELSLRDELRASEARFRLLVEESPDTVVRILLNPWRIGYMSPSIVNITGCTRDEYYADPSLLAGFIHPDDLDRVKGLFTASNQAERLEYRLIHRDGSIRTIDLHSNIVVTAGTPTAVEATLRDITHRVAEHDNMIKLAHHDELTGLANRRAILAALDQRLTARQATAVIFLDLNHFKAVNDTYGHDAGDEVLRTVALRLTAALRDGDQVGRLGGDEFVVISHPELAPALARRLADHLTVPITLSRGPVVNIGASVGITTFDPTGAVPTAGDLLRHADHAMFRDKQHRNHPVEPAPLSQCCVAE
jgi:diguanylate cyclase (GGDEF)-like protein/PAS domain S-box-containing protein